MNSGRFMESLKALGPGLLFAGAAIGVSHLVQSTRAGALFGLGLIGVILLANVSKYPGLSFGSRYSHATGLSLLEGYRRQGKWTLVVFSLLTLGSMFTVTAAVTLVTAAIFNELILGRILEGASLQLGCIILMVTAAVLLKTGGYAWLDKMIKALLGTMALLTFAATAMVLPDVDWSTLSLTFPQTAMNATAIGFIVALAGWMPAPLDISVWNSMWALAKQAETGRPATPQENRFDFNVGFGLCVIMALCFVVLGTVVMHQPGIEPAAGGVGMAKQILSLFTKSLGAWSYPIVGASSLAVMFSTTLTVLDAFPRVLVVLKDRFSSEEKQGEAARDLAKESNYWIAYAMTCGGSLVLLYFFLTNLKQLVDLATTLSFVTTPILAWFNHRAMFSNDVPEAYRPSPAMKIYSLSCVALLSVFALFYLWTRFAA
jgi:Mn2+/Fe2+ NRAMP family transporter